MQGSEAYAKRLQFELGGEDVRFCYDSPTRSIIASCPLHDLGFAISKETMACRSEEDLLGSVAAAVNALRKACADDAGNSKPAS